MKTNLTPAQAHEMRAVAMETPERPTCPRCGHKMHEHGVQVTGSGGGRIQRWFCPQCGKTSSTKIGLSYQVSGGV